MLFSTRMRQKEQHLLSLYRQKIGKIPALIETIRPYSSDDRAFETLTRLHRDAMISNYASIYDILGHNLAIQKEFEFLMKLSMQIPEIQTQESYIYIRDFIMKYERSIKSYLSEVNQAIKKHNQFVTIKNLTIIGLLLPGQKMREIQ